MQFLFYILLSIICLRKLSSRVPGNMSSQDAACFAKIIEIARYVGVKKRAENLNESVLKEEVSI